MADPQRRYRKMAPATDRELILKIDEALAAEGKGRKLWYWPASPRGHLKASAVIDETRGYVRPVALTALADELGCDCSNGENAASALSITIKSLSCRLGTDAEEIAAPVRRAEG
jgi:hypothetical protein